MRLSGVRWMVARSLGLWLAVLFAAAPLLLAIPRSKLRPPLIRPPPPALQVTLAVTGQDGPVSSGYAVTKPWGQLKGVTVNMTVLNSGGSDSGQFWASCEIIVNGKHLPNQNYGADNLAKGAKKTWSFYVANVTQSIPLKDYTWVKNLQNDLGEALETDIVLQANTDCKDCKNQSNKNNASFHVDLFEQLQVAMSLKVPAPNPRPHTVFRSRGPSRAAGRAAAAPAAAPPAAAIAPPDIAPQAAAAPGAPAPAAEPGQTGGGFAERIAALRARVRGDRPSNAGAQTSPIGGIQPAAESERTFAPQSETINALLPDLTVNIAVQQAGGPLESKPLNGIDLSPMHVTIGVANKGAAKCGPFKTSCKISVNGKAGSTQTFQSAGLDKGKFVNFSPPDIIYDQSLDQWEGTYTQTYSVGYLIEVTVDPDNAITESNKTNNYAKFFAVFWHK